MKSSAKKFVVSVILGIGLAYIEAAVVVYLRAIFYPEGFDFPLPEFGSNVLWRTFLTIEIGREAATLVVLLAGSYLLGYNFRSRLAYFLTLFAIWDIFYYVWLKVLLNWPASIMDWDILFLIPSPWAGPVLAPVIISVTILLMALAILYREGRHRPLRPTRTCIVGFILISIVLIGMFCWAGMHITEAGYKSCFSWPVFAGGELLGITLFLLCYLRSDQQHKES